MSGLTLIAVVVIDLQRAVGEHEARARERAQRDAQRIARTIRQRLEVELEPQPPFDPARELDVLAQERLARAAPAQKPDAALAELRPLPPAKRSAASTRAANEAA